MFIDTHAHLDFKQFNSDRDEVIARARQCGVEKIIIPGTNMENSRKALKIAKKYDFIYAAAGIHPHDASEDAALLSSLAEDKKIVAIGECGLDFYRNFTPRDVQIEAFKKQIELARSTKLPLIVHSRGAEEECFTMLAESGVKAVFHCFSGTLTLARRLWDRGFLTSFTGNITYSKSEELVRIIKEVPDDLFMIETDCPFLAPRKYRGQRNEPAYVTEIAAKIAEIKGQDLNEIARKSTRSAEIFFAILT